MKACSHSLAAAHHHPWPTGHVFESPGAHLTYRVVGPCCRLYDREQLPWPACRIQWRSKEPSWRRIGKRLIADMATRKHPSYSVEIVGQSYRSEPVVMTLYTEVLSAECKDWWHTKRLTEERLTGEGVRAITPQVASQVISTDKIEANEKGLSKEQAIHRPVAIPTVKPGRTSMPLTKQTSAPALT